jgi:hypothetical protein
MIDLVYCSHKDDTKGSIKRSGQHLQRSLTHLELPK